MKGRDDGDDVLFCVVSLVLSTASMLMLLSRERTLHIYTNRCIESYIKKQSYYYPFTKIPSTPYWAFENISFMNLLSTLDK